MRGAALIALVCLGGALSARAFMPNADLLVISPPLGKAGESVEVSLSGTDLDEVTTLRFADARFKVEPVTTPADEFHPEPRPVVNRFRVTIPEDAAPGLYEARSAGFFGLSTARPFLVLPKDSVEKKEEGQHSSQETALPLEVEEGMFGVLEGRQFDWYRFPAKKGERLLVQVLAERLDSKADCQIALADAAGRELESSRDFFGSDPMVDFTALEDGDYFIALSDTLYRGGAEYFYRLQVTKKPQVDFVFPPAGVPGQKTKFTFYGRNLPGGSLEGGAVREGKALETITAEVTVPAEPSLRGGIQLWKPRQSLLPVWEHRVGEAAASIGFATAPVVIEAPETGGPQKVTVPCEVAGRFDVVGDSDVYRFSARKGETWWIEAISDRMGVMADPYLMIQRVGGEAKPGESAPKVAENDDPPSLYAPNTLNDLNIDTLDSIVKFTPDQDGEYDVTLLNQSGGGGLAHRYRLAIRQAQPGFHLLSGTERTKTINNDAYPMSPVLRRGGSVVYRLVALREDGFEGDITITAEGLPEGVSSRPLVLSGKSEEGFLALVASAEAKPWQGAIKLVGSAQVNGQEMRREARNGAIIWGKRVFANQAQVRSRMDEEIVLSVLDTEVEPSRVAPVEDKVFTVELNQTLEIPIKVAETGARQGALQVEVYGFPGMLRGAPSVSIPEGQAEGTLVIPCKPTGNFKIAAGQYQFVLQGVGNAKYRRNPASIEKAQAEAKRFEALAVTLAGEAVKARELLALAKQDFDKISQQSASAADDQARAALKGELDGAKARLDAAAKSATEAEARLPKVETLKTAAQKAVKDAEDKAKEQSMQFATYSLPITVVVTEPPPAVKK